MNTAKIVIGSDDMSTEPNTYVAYHVHSMLSNGTTNIDSMKILCMQN